MKTTYVFFTLVSRRTLLLEVEHAENEPWHNTNFGFMHYIDLSGDKHLLGLTKIKSVSKRGANLHALGLQPGHTKLLWPWANMEVVELIG